MPTVIARLIPGLLLASGLLVCGLLAGCGTPVPAPTASTPAASTASPASTLSSSTSPTPSASGLPTPPTDSAVPSPSASESGTGTSRTATASPSYPNPETGTYGTDLTVSGSKLEFTRLRWYWGRDALARCKKEGLKPDGPWCNDYFFEDEGERVTTTVARDVQVKVLDENAKLRSATRAQLDRAISESIWPHFVIQLADGEAVAITQIYTP